MQIHKPTLTQLENGRVQVAFVFIEAENQRHNLLFELPEEHLNLEQMTSALYLSLLLLAYVQGGKLNIDGQISKQLLGNSQTILNIMRKWLPYKYKNELDLSNITEELFFKVEV